MRRIIIETFIRHFGATRFDTAYFEGNAASRRVSEKLGDSPNGHRTRVGQNGTALKENHMTLSAHNWKLSDKELQVTGHDAVRNFLTITT